MSTLKIYAVIVLTTVLAGAALAAPGRGGGGGGRGGGGAPHAMGGGAHFGGGGAHFGGGGGPHFGGGARVGGGGMRFGGAPQIGGGARFSGRPAISRFAARPSFHGSRSFAAHGNPGRNTGRAATLNANRSAGFARNRNANLGQNRTANIQNRAANARSNAVRNALNSRAVAGALHNRAALRNANARAQIAASAATAGWHGGRGGRDGWWRHRHGGFGWVGPLFWPFAYYDISDYALWGYDDGPLFWDYGYNDIYAGIFSPYGYDDLAGYLPAGAAGPAAADSQQTVGRAGGNGTPPTEQIAQLCGDDSRDIAGLPIDRIQQALQVNDAQRAALDDLANTSVKAAQDIKAACPSKITLTAPGRLAAMQARVEAMIAAVKTVQPSLQKFYDLLSDEQRARLNALAQDQRNRETARNGNGSLAQNCQTAQASVPEWPTAEIESRLHPNEAQRASLTSLQQATAKATEMLKASCPATEPITPPARLEAIRNRLDTMLQAVKKVRVALDDFYGKLNDEQKAQFEAIGPARGGPSGRSAASDPDQPATTRTHGRRHHHAGIPGILRHIMSMARW
jgi:LTXXQ motif family protein